MKNGRNTAEIEDGMKARTWTLHFTSRESFAVTCIPEATRDEVPEKYPQAVACEPQSERVEKPVEALTVAEQAGIRRWLHRIGEADARTVAEVVRRCQEDLGHRRYFLSRANEIPAEHTATTTDEAHADRQSGLQATKAAPLGHRAAEVAKSYTENYTEEAVNG